MSRYANILRYGSFVLCIHLRRIALVLQNIYRAERVLYPITYICIYVNTVKQVNGSKTSRSFHRILKK